MKLSRRQKDVCELLATGKPNKEIARSLGLSVNSVRTHCLAAYRKLGAENRTQAALIYRGIV